MPTFTSSGKKIFLAELTALSVITTIKINQKISGTFDVRHKIAENALDDMYNSCIASEENTYERLLCICKLMVFASAAYSESDIKSMISTKKASFASLEVHPHFGGARMIVNAYPNEPLNLWFGLATENRELNQKLVDPHMVKIDSYGGIKYRVSQPSNQAPSDASDSRNEEFSKVAFVDKSLELAGPHASSPVRPSRSKIPDAKPTPVSEALTKHAPALVWEFKSFVASDEEIYGPKEIVESFGKVKGAGFDLLNLRLKTHYDNLVKSLLDMKLLVSEMNFAGRKHYGHILEEMDLRGIDEDENFYKTIKDARDSWNINREKLLAILIKTTADLKKRSYLLGLHQKKVTVPANFFLLPIDI